MIKPLYNNDRQKKCVHPVILLILEEYEGMDFISVLFVIDNGKRTIYFFIV